MPGYEPDLTSDPNPAHALARHPEVGQVDLVTRRVVDPAIHQDYAEVEESLGEGARIVVLEDTVTTGGSTLRAVETLRERGLHVAVAGRSARSDGAIAIPAADRTSSADPPGPWRGSPGHLFGGR